MLDWMLTLDERLMLNEMLMLEQTKEKTAARKLGLMLERLKDFSALSGWRQKICESGSKTGRVFVPW